MLLLQQHPSMPDPRNLPGYKEVTLLEQEYNLFLIMFIEFCFNKYYSVCALVYIIITVFHFIIAFFKN